MEQQQQQKRPTIGVGTEVYSTQNHIPEFITFLLTGCFKPAYRYLVPECSSQATPPPHRHWMSPSGQVAGRN